jgi:hypothetical protein
MKKLLAFVFAIILVFSIGLSNAYALSFDYSNDPDPNVVISNDNYVPNASNWYQMHLPDWYDSNYVSAFTIDMYGTADDSTRTIDIWRKLGDSGAEAMKIVGFDVMNNGRAFILRMDLMNDNLYRNYKKFDGTWTGWVDTNLNLSNIGLSDFDDLDSFLIGYACHFTYKKTSLHIEQSEVPEPATLLFLGLGLLGVVGIKRRILK